VTFGVIHRYLCTSACSTVECALFWKWAQHGRSLGFLWRGLSYFKENVLASLSFGNNGIFGFHQLYYSSLRLDPIPETGLFIVLF
jgi:hypothetical protein